MTILWCGKNKSQLGFTLMEMMIAAAAASVVTIGVAKMTGDMFKADKKVASMLVNSTMGIQVQSLVSCARTFQGAPQGNPCANGSYIDLLADTGRPVVRQGGTQIGDWTLRARCNATAGSIEIRAAKLMPGAPVLNFPVGPGQYNPAHYRVDEGGGINTAVTPNRPMRYDWEHPRSLLLPVGAGVGLCAASFVPADPNPVRRCAGNQILVGFDFMTGRAECQTVAGGPCTGERALKYVNNTWVCENAMTDATLDSMAWNRVQVLVPQIATLQTNARISAQVPGMISREISRNNRDFVAVGDRNIVTQSNTFTQTKFNNMVNGARYDLIQSNDSDCALLRNFTCRDGYFAYGLENRMQTEGNNCRIRCQAIQ
jgi:prepilin-type N-terminal cleavage/methylation domain-containing protein